MQKINKQFKVKYLYHYTKKNNVESILNDKTFKSIDDYTFFTGSLNDSISTFENEMMTYKSYIDVDLKVKQRDNASKDDYAIIKIPYIEDNNFYMFDFNNKDSIYNKSIVHKGSYSFDKAEVLEFPKTNYLNIKKVLASLALTTSLFFPFNAFADSWLDSPNYDISWYEPSSSWYDIDDGADLAGLAYLVNVSNITFAGKEFSINNDMSLIDHDWELIKDIFAGAVCGAHRVLLKGNNSKLFESGNDYGMDFAYYYPAVIVDKDNVNHDIFLTSDELISNLKTRLTSLGLFSTNSILMYKDSVIKYGIVSGNDIEENSTLKVYEGKYIAKLPDGSYLGINCESSDSIETIKTMLQSVLNIIPERIKIYYNSNELDENKTLLESSVPDIGIMELVIKGLISINPSNDGTTTTDKDYADVGETVTITTSPKDNYKLKDIKIYHGEDDVTDLVNLSDNQFLMPKYDVNIVATYEIINPKTFDGITSYIMLGVISLIGIMIFPIKKILIKK